MKTDLLQRNKIFLSIIILLILSFLNLYNLKDKAFIKLEKFDVSINNKILAKEFTKRIRLQNLKITHLKKISTKEMPPQIQIESDNSFLLIVNWNEKTQDDLLSLIKKNIYQEYIDVFKEAKENIQNSFLMNEEFFSEDTNNIIDKTKIDEIAHLKKINKYFYSLKIYGAETYITINNQLKMISEINKNNYTIININKSYEKKEYLIFFAMIFNQLIIFIIVIFFYRSIPNNFK
jgi:hypothetical protein